MGRLAVPRSHSIFPPPSFVSTTEPDRPLLSLPRPRPGVLYPSRCSSGISSFYESTPTPPKSGLSASLPSQEPWSCPIVTHYILTSLNFFSSHYTLSPLRPKTSMYFSVNHRTLHSTWHMDLKLESLMNVHMRMSAILLR